MKKVLILISAVICAAGIYACNPVGSEGWCNKMKEKPKGDWTANEAKEYASNCLMDREE